MNMKQTVTETFPTRGIVDIINITTRAQAIVELIADDYDDAAEAAVAAAKLAADEYDAYKANLV